MWVVDNLEDVKSDMSAFHRVDDIHAIPASVFFPRAERLGAYPGIISYRAKVKQLAEQQPAAAPGSRAPIHNPREAKTVPAEVMLAEHQNSGWVERG